MFLGAMSRPKLEADVLIRNDLELSDRTIDGADREGCGLFPEWEWVIIRLGLYGVGGRLAVTRLNGLRRHGNSSIRQWPGEALVTGAKSCASPSSQSGSTGR